MTVKSYMSTTRPKPARNVVMHRFTRADERFIAARAKPTPYDEEKETKLF